MDDTNLWAGLGEDNDVNLTMAKEQESINSWGNNLLAVGGELHPDKCSYKALLGVYWRHVDPTRATQFPLDASEEGDAFRTVIWVADADERKLAEQSRKVMEAAEVYGKNKKFLTEISDAQSFTPTPEDGQDLYTADAKAYQKAIKKSGRAKFFEKTYEPITTTACEEKTCGYVYFPCSAENGCMGIVSGTW